MRLELKINNEPRALPSVQGFVRFTLQQIPMSETDVVQLEQLILYAVRHAIEHAYLCGEVGAIELMMSESEGRVEITIRDYGLPEDVRRLETELSKSSAAGIASHEAAEIVDEMHWIAFGPQGKSLQFIKWLQTPAVTESSPDSELGKVTQEAPLAPEQQYEFRRMESDDALQVSRLIYQTYGGTYFNEDVYYPERIASANKESRVLSVVAVGDAGNIAGHCALERNQLGPVAEVGQAVVDPRHRGRGLLNHMKAALEDEARALGLIGWFANSVAIHTYTQQSNAHHGGHVCGVSLAVSPKSESFRGIAKELSQRVSCILYFHWLADPTPRRLFVPERHRVIIAAIYENLQCPLEILDSTDLHLKTGVRSVADTESRQSPVTSGSRKVVDEHGTNQDSKTYEDSRSLSVQVNPRARLATVRTGELNQGSLHSIRHAVRELVERSRMEVVVVELPLTSPLTPKISEGLEEEGLGFSGIGPCFSSGGDVLQMTYLVEPLERDPIKTFEPFADRLVQYTLGEQQRVRREV